jgi:hypothetical protein
MMKEMPKSSWVDFLMNFAKNHEGQIVRLYAEDGFEGKKLVGENMLIAFEGDCDGEIVNGVKVVIGDEGDNPNNVFHFIKSPQKIEVDEDENGVIGQVILESSDNVKTTLELE